MANWIYAFPSLKPRPLSSVHRVNLHATSPTSFRPTTRNTAELPLKAITNTIRAMWSHNGSIAAIMSGTRSRRARKRTYIAASCSLHTHQTRYR
jgi:hypothetical protein